MEALAATSHSVTEDTEFERYMIPKNATVTFLVSEIKWDEKAWEKPKEFKLERFTAGGEGEEVDLMGNREIKMTRAWRSICPGLRLAMLHLENGPIDKEKRKCIL
ncbi:hypothetical protein HPP92_012891 [Vanilla planifolia]|nr:hypothetical protein HPP92_012891 [Vanilla planifolia]